MTRTDHASRKLTCAANRTLLVFDGPHQPDEEARSILKNLLTDPKAAKDSDIIAAGVPLRFDGVSSYDHDHPFPEFLTRFKGILTVGSEDCVTDKKMGCLIKWANICRQRPNNIAGALQLCDVLGQKIYTGRPLHMIAWYFSDFICADIWEPALGSCGLARSIVDGTPSAGADFRPLCADRDRGILVDPNLIRNQRNL